MCILIYPINIAIQVLFTLTKTGPHKIMCFLSATLTETELKTSPRFTKVSKTLIFFVLMRMLITHTVHRQLEAPNEQ